MNASPRLLVASILPFLGAGTLLIADAEYRVPAVVMAVVGVAAVWLAESGQQKPSGFSRLAKALSQLRQGTPFEEPPEDAPPGEMRCFTELEKLHGSMDEKLSTLRQELEQVNTKLKAVESNGNAQALSRFRALSSTVAPELRRLQGDIADKATAAERALAQSQQLADGFHELLRQSELLASTAEEGSSAILQMSATNSQMATNITELSVSVRESVASIEEMTYSMREVARNVDALSLTAEETASSMNEMDVSIDQVQSNANETARLSEEVARDAETGADAILKTIEEIHRMRDSSSAAVRVMSNLDAHIAAVGKILSVIDDVAEQTNLLALNAAIIAAQAGEHGKGFSVVAEEIKLLAERSSRSTKEIAELIKGIQHESLNAIRAVERGAENVERGVQVSGDAETALRKILESSQKSTNMVRAIARATVEQAKGSRQVTDAIGRIAETVQQIAAATAEQARGSELIMNSSEKMRTIAQMVERSSQEQARGSKQITGAIEQVNALVDHLSRAQQERRQGMDDVNRSVRNLHAFLQDELARLRQVSEQVDALQRQAP